MNETDEDGILVAATPVQEREIFQREISELVTNITPYIYNINLKQIEKTKQECIRKKIRLWSQSERYLHFDGIGKVSLTLKHYDKDCEKLVIINYNDKQNTTTECSGDSQIALVNARNVDALLRKKVKAVLKINNRKYCKIDFIIYQNFLIKNPHKK